MSTVNILVVEDDPATQTALRQVLDAEEWRGEIAATPDSALQVLASGDWTLVVASVGTTGLTSPLYMILKELSQAPVMESGKSRIRILFLIPETGAGTALPQLEQDHLQYVLKPFNLHDILEKVSDLLMETGAIPQSIRQVRREGLSDSRRRDAGKMFAGRGGRNTQMFSTRNDYPDYGVSEEEIAEYERQQKEETLRKKKSVKDLGSGGR
jgi:DNA-binding response OmpR family regulator